jgi:hypothetical protein
MTQACWQEVKMLEKMHRINSFEVNIIFSDAKELF